MKRKKDLEAIKHNGKKWINEKELEKALRYKIWLVRRLNTIQIN